MNISPFKVEEWMNAYETQATINIAETCVNSVSLDELFALTGENKQAFLNAFCQRRLTYGDIVGKPELREGICDLFKTLRPDEVATTHGAAAQITWPCMRSFAPATTSSACCRPISSCIPFRSPSARRSICFRCARKTAFCRISTSCAVSSSPTPGLSA